MQAAALLALQSIGRSFQALLRLHGALLAAAALVGSSGKVVLHPSPLLVVLVDVPYGNVPPARPHC